ncbi:MAG: response regulator [Solobacterium sp.]|jgi:CheY-like chemotaxis protein|nr:response regulator [Solobacterium sp.]MCH4222247.1 response regulator [Solobacterium sp.]MCH4265767.1 response regulator [Solobacterium sp.]
MYVDVLKSQQMFMNLLNNACKYTPVGGHVTMRFKHLKAEGNLSTDQIIIKDDGCGMSEEFLKERIFKPFEQERTNVTGAVQGTGLGLALSKRIANAMGGNITARSKLGEGSEFIVTFTYQFRRQPESKPVTKRQPKEQKSDSFSLEGCSILVAEDHLLNRQIVTELLKLEGMNVTPSVNGEEALKLFSNAKPGTYDAILMDIRMPVMDGVEATRAIRALDRPDVRKIPIIAMTAYAFDEDREITRKAGMNAHLSKPINTEQLFSTLKEQIQNSRK